MLPYTRIYLKLLFYYGGPYADGFLKKYNITPPNQELFKEFSSIFLKYLDDEQRSFFLERPFHTIVNKGKTAKSIIDVVNHYFGADIKEKPSAICNITNERILKNRQLRIFIEILIVGQVPFKIIEKSLLKKFRLNPPISEEQIKDYSFWFFEPEMMDDYDWQIFWKTMESDCDTSKDKLKKKEVEDKKYCFRREPLSALLRMGVGDEMNYVGMLKTVGENIFSQIEEDWDMNAPFSEVEKKYKMLKSIGSEYHKHSESKGSGNFYEDFEMELEYHSQSTLTGFDNGEVVDMEEFSKRYKDSQDNKNTKLIEDKINSEDEYGHFPED